MKKVMKFLSSSVWNLQLADAKEVLKGIQQEPGVRYPVLTPNLRVSSLIISSKKCIPLQLHCCTYLILEDMICTNELSALQGFEAAIAAGAKEIAVFASASESFSKSNINCTIEESLVRYRGVTAAAKKHGLTIRG
jgi:hydroxymethylglutaryl-CoA lyase